MGFVSVVLGDLEEFVELWFSRMMKQLSNAELQTETLCKKHLLKQFSIAQYKNALIQTMPINNSQHPPTKEFTVLLCALPSGWHLVTLICTFATSCIHYSSKVWLTFEQKCMYFVSCFSKKTSRKPQQDLRSILQVQQSMWHKLYIHRLVWEHLYWHIIRFKYGTMRFIMEHHWFSWVSSRMSNIAWRILTCHNWI